LRGNAVVVVVDVGSRMLPEEHTNSYGHPSSSYGHQNESYGHLFNTGDDSLGNAIIFLNETVSIMLEKLSDAHHVIALGLPLAGLMHK
jgi:hypothetical protein